MMLKHEKMQSLKGYSALINTKMVGLGHTNISLN